MYQNWNWTCVLGGRHGRVKRVPCHWCRLKGNFDNLNKTLVAKQRLNMCTRALPLARHGRAKQVLWYKCRSKYNIDDSDERSTPELRWELCTKTGIKDEYQNWDQACVPGGPAGKLWPAPEARLSLRGPCRRCRSKACLYIKRLRIDGWQIHLYLTKQFTRSSPTPSCPILPQTTTKLISIVL